MNKNYSVQSIGESLLRRGIKPSYPRIKVLECLMVRENHPTVDQIYAELVREIPTLSKTTVYNTLNLLIQTDLAKLVTIEVNETRYDANTENHGHFKCKTCGTIYDFPIDVEELAADALKRFRVHEKDVYFKGVCPDCLE